MLRNLSDAALQQLTDFFNDTVWKTDGRLPSEWKTANIMLIPKPEKPRELGNYDPSRSPLAKLFERVVLNRIERHIEQNDLLQCLVSGEAQDFC